MRKVELDGKIAVLVSPGFGAGWSTWNDDQYSEILCMDADIIEAVRDGDFDRAITIAQEKIGVENYLCSLGMDGIEIFWIPKGSQFEIQEYDGSESLRIISRISYMTA